jgi:hypothetical protein
MSHINKSQRRDDDADEDKNNDNQNRDSDLAPNNLQHVSVMTQNFHQAYNLAL